MRLENSQRVYVVTVFSSVQTLLNCSGGNIGAEAAARDKQRRCSARRAVSGNRARVLWQAGGGGNTQSDPAPAAGVAACSTKWERGVNWK